MENIVETLQKVTPFYEPDIFDEGIAAAEKFGFKPTNLSAYHHPNGFISVRFSWDSTGEMKYAGTGYKSYAHNDCSIELDFKEVKYRYKDLNGVESDFDSTFRIEIGLQKEDSNEQIKYQPLFIENLKYEVQVWFAPCNWEGEAKEFFNMKLD